MFIRPCRIKSIHFSPDRNMSESNRYTCTRQERQFKTYRYESIVKLNPPNVSNIGLTSMSLFFAVINMSSGDVSVTDGTTTLGGTAVLRCITSSPTREHLTVHSWQTDDGFAMSTDSNVIGNKYHTSHNGRVLLVHSVTPQEEKRRFRCSVYNKLTGRKVNSLQWAKITIIGEYRSGNFARTGTGHAKCLAKSEAISLKFWISSTSGFTYRSFGFSISLKPLIHTFIGVAFSFCSSAFFSSACRPMHECGNRKQRNEKKEDGEKRSRKPEELVFVSAVCSMFCDCCRVATVVAACRFCPWLLCGSLCVVFHLSGVS